MVNIIRYRSLRILQSSFRTSYRYNSTITQNPLKIISTLTEGNNKLELETISRLYNKYGLHLFLHNMIIALFERHSNNLLDLQKFDVLFNFIMKKYLNNVIKDSCDYISPSFIEMDLETFENLQGDEKLEKLLLLLLKLSLSTNSSSLAFNLMFKIIEKSQIDENFKSNIINKQNISTIVDLLSVSRSQSRNIKELDNIFILVSSFNKFVEKTNESLKFEFTDDQILSIIDKAKYSIEEQTQTNTDLPFVSVEVISSPYTTIQQVIRQLGLIISKRVSKTVSYYVENEKENANENDINKTTVLEDNDDQEITNELGNDISSDLINDYKVDELIDKQLLTKYLQFCYFIINERCQNNDPTAVYIIWTTIKPFHNKVYNSIINSETNNLSNNFYYYQTVSKVITLFSKNKRYSSLVTDLIYDLPLDSVKVCPELMSTIIYHCSRTNNKSLASIVISRYDKISQVKSNDTTKTLNIQELFGQGGDLTILGTGEKFTAGQTHALLAYNLKIGNNKLVLKIIEYLKHKLIGFTASDFNEIIKSVLRNEKVNDNDNENDNDNDNDKKMDKKEIAWEMIHNNFLSHEPELNKYAIVTYVDHIVTESLGKNEPLNMKRINEIYELMELHYSKKDVKFWNHFNMVYFKYIIRKYPINIAKIVYLNNKKFTKQSNFLNKSSIDIEQICYFQKVDEYGFYNNPFNTHFNDVRINLNVSLRLMILRDFYQQCDGYFKRAKSLNSVDLDDARIQLNEFADWIYKELIEINYNENNENLKSLNKLLIIDLLRTTNKKSRKIGINIGDYQANEKKNEKKNNISDSERKYRIEQGEKFPIGEITLKEEFDESLMKNDDIWKDRFSKN